MKGVRFLAVIFALAISLVSTEALAYGHAGIAPWAYGANFRAGVGAGYAPGAFGAVRPAWYGPYGRYPKLYFRAPLRRALGLPGFTPVRQFLFGRGAIRRQTRRAAIFGRGFRC